MCTTTHRLTNLTLSFKFTFSQGYYRKGCALLGLNSKTEAVAAFLHCLARDPDNKSVKKSVTKVLCKIILKRVR